MHVARRYIIYVETTFWTWTNECYRRKFTLFLPTFREWYVYSPLQGYNSYVVPPTSCYHVFLIHSAGSFDSVSYFASPPSYPFQIHLSLISYLAISRSVLLWVSYSSLPLSNNEREAQGRTWDFTFTFSLLFLFSIIFLNISFPKISLSILVQPTLRICSMFTIFSNCDFNDAKRWNLTLHSTKILIVSSYYQKFYIFYYTNYLL